MPGRCHLWLFLVSETCAGGNFFEAAFQPGQAVFAGLVPRVELGRRAGEGRLFSTELGKFGAKHGQFAFLRIHFAREFLRGRHIENRDGIVVQGAEVIHLAAEDYDLVSFGLECGSELVLRRFEHLVNTRRFVRDQRAVLSWKWLVARSGAASASNRREVFVFMIFPCVLGVIIPRDALFGSEGPSDPPDGRAAQIRPPPKARHPPGDDLRNCYEGSILFTRSIDYQ